MSISQIHTGKHRQNCFTLENTAIPHVNLEIFTKLATVSSDHDAETRASPPLFRHSNVTAHLIREQITVMDDPGFQNEC